MFESLKLNIENSFNIKKSFKGWFELNRSTTSGPSKPDMSNKVNSTAVIPVPISGKSQTVYCLGGEWLQIDGRSMSDCVPLSTTGKNSCRTLMPVSQGKSR